MPSVANGKAIKSKNQLRRLKAKQKKATAATAESTPVRILVCNHATFLMRYGLQLVNGVDVKMYGDEEGDENVEYVVEQLDLLDPALEAFSNILAKFQVTPDTTEVRPSTLLVPLHPHSLTRTHTDSSIPKTPIPPKAR